MVNYTLGDGFRNFDEFQIRPISGDICISGALDHETRSVYEFPVVATDRGGLSTTAMVKIQLIDVNDNKPTFYPAQYNVSLREQHMSSSPVVVVVATDKDTGIYGQVTYEIVSGNDDAVFRLDAKTGELYVTRPLSKTSTIHHLKVSARDGAGLVSDDNAAVSISVNDITQEPPIFERPRYIFSASENIPSGTSVGTVTASSNGRSGGGGEVRYSIYSGDPNGYFKIDPRRGVLRTASELDHEAQSFVLLNVLATTGNPPAYGHTQVNISIWDVNDNAPEFDVSSVKISVPENALLNEAIYAAHATDLDSGNNGVVHYRLLQNPDRIFRIDKQGLLTLEKHLDYEAAQRYTLIVEAEDRGDPRLSSNLTVNLEVQDVNDNPPVFEKEKYFISVLESVPINTQFLQVIAIDQDTGNNARLTYSIKEKEFDTIFGVFPNSGSLYLKKVLDRETRSSYVLTVVATDNGIPISTASATVTISVLDANDNAPVFTKQVYEFTIEENLQPGTVVGSVSAEDKDLGNNASLRFSLSAKDTTSFKINPITGEIVTRVALDREDRAVYEVTVEVRDEGQPPKHARATVRVLVTDVNDNSPTFIEPQEPSVSVREDQPAGTEVLQVRATDRDEGNNASITYSFLTTEDTDDDGAFTINPNTGSITTTKVLDQKAKSVYQVVVQASDHGTPPKTVNKTIKIVAVNMDEAPSFSSSSLTFEIVEGLSVGEEIGQAMTPDKDSSDNGRITYTIVSGNVNGTFDINRSTGQLFTTRDVDYEVVPDYMLQIKAVDSSALSPRSFIITVSVVVQDINDNWPVFAEDPVVVTISESIPIGSVVWNFTAVDLDSGGNGEIHYSITQQTPKKVFKLDPATGVLTLMTPVDHEEIKDFILVVTATDMPKNDEHKLRTSVTARILIEDFNDNNPKFISNNRVDVMEDEAIDYPVLHLRAIDEDSGENGRVTYIINSGNEEGHFKLDYDTGLLTIAKSLDREKTGHYRLNTSATDHGTPQRSAQQMIEIYVIDVNDNTPKFNAAIYRANVSEGSSPGTHVTRVMASDRDYGSNGNLTYIIPSGIGNNKFRINPSTGEIRTIATLDREEKEEYSLTVYVRDGSYPALYDTASVLVSLSDVNDHAPEFRDSCYPLRVPENTELSVIHTVLATDRDTGLNGQVTYSIIGGDPGSKFNIDTYTGQLSSKPLDREERGKYFLVITAEDRGEPPLRGICNITITVEDQNDNDPQFTQNKYTATVYENALLETTVLQVQATDKDQGDNARITYSLSNETQWLFKVDNITGVITTAGKLDREKQSLYTFEVRATDGGQYDARSQTVQVQISISDVNDNQPTFLEYPFRVTVPTYKQPGKQIVKVTAVDKDEGANAQIIYSLVNKPVNNKFRIDSETGIVIATSQLGLETGRLFHLEVVARDKGTPSLSSTGLIEIHVGDTSSSTTLQFQNALYAVHLPENSYAGTDVVQVLALRSDGRRQRITYSFGSGNEENIFEMNSNNGLIRVRDPWKLDYESVSEIRLTVMAEAEGEPPLYAYTSVHVQLVDMNDNAPKFTQDQYVSSVWEGNNKGTYVMQISATDEDTGQNSKIIYDIVDGNLDNAFIIDPPFSGIVKTNIVLDREIRDAYKLTIIATDEGTAQLTGTCTLRITIVDINDNQPTFPPHSIVHVSESSEVGTLITTITANDVDTNPAITYNFARGGNPGSMFSIDKFSGKIVLAAHLDHEVQEEYMLKVEASDTAHIAKTSITVQVVDENDNAPVFSQQAYQVQLPELSPIGTSVIKVSATDVDKGPNAEVVYSLTSAPDKGFYIDENTGILYANFSVLYNPQQPMIQLVVAARDKGKPSLSSVAAVRIQITDVNNNSPKFTRQIYKSKVKEDASMGHVVARVTAVDEDASRYAANIDYSIVKGNVGSVFHVGTSTGEVIIVKNLDRETQAEYVLEVKASDRGQPARNATCKVVVSVTDINDNPPVFSREFYTVNVSELMEVGSDLIQVHATDGDEEDNAKISYDITSGNDQELFALDTETGSVLLREPLNFETASEHRLIIRATDKSYKNPLSALTTVFIVIKDENEPPKFPVERYYKFISENSPIGVSVFTAHANDVDKGYYGTLTYSITSGEDMDKFSVNSKTGVVTTKASFDYESRQGYHFNIKAVDVGGKSATVSAQVNIESRDEFAPVFIKPDYYFVVKSSADAGTVVGQISATDRDEGPDGRVFYSLRTASSLFKINRTSGLLTLSRQSKRNKGIKLEVEANSGLVGSLKSVALARISIGGENVTWNGTDLVGDPQQSAGMASWMIAAIVCLMVLLLLFGFIILWLFNRQSRNKKQTIGDHFDTSFDTIATAPADLSQYPPRYNDIRHYDHHHGNRAHHHGNTTSEMSEQSQSTSSGRGSADDNEDVEDEEIRMINEGPLIKEQKLRERHGIPSSGIHDDDNMSDVSVHNTQEYLARLGIDTSKNESTKGSQDLSHSMNRIHMFEDEGVPESDGMDISNLIYAKLNEVSTEDDTAILDRNRGFGFVDESQPSMTGSLSSIVHSEEELQGSYNWDYLLDWGPQYQPLAHVFSEIARLKDDSAPNYNRDHSKKTLNPQVKTNPPPLLTSVAPRSIAPVALTSGRTNQITLPSLPRSPISHESSFTPPAMSPSFSPSLSPLATRSPSISPLMTPGSHVTGPGVNPQASVASTPHHGRAIGQRAGPAGIMAGTSSGSEPELRI